MLSSAYFIFHAIAQSSLFRLLVTFSEMYMTEVMLRISENVIRYTHDFVDWRKKLNTSVKNRVYKMSYFTGINNLQSATHDLMRVSKQV